jgi:hypothetical protein
MTTVFREQKETHQENREEELRRLRPVRTVGDQDVGGCCPACGHHLGAVEPLLSEDPMVDVVPDRAAFGTALRTVVLLVDVLDQRRPPKHLGDLVEPLVLRYLRAVPAGTDGLRGGVRLLTFHPAQPHEGAVEVAATIRLRGRRRALAASFELAGIDRWVCQTVRIL